MRKLLIEKFQIFLGVLIAGMVLGGCEQSTAYKQSLQEAQLLHRSMKQLTDVIVYDIFSPPQASRIYAYPSIAAYEVLRHEHSDFISLANQLHGLEPLPAPETGKDYAFPLAGVHAFLTVGKALIFSENQIDEFQEKLFAEMKQHNIPRGVYNRSIEYGEAVAQSILAWADKDNYKQTRTFPKFTITDDPGRWQPTPPDYADGIEPHWNKIRPFIIDSATQFVPVPPTPFNEDKNSKFFEELMEVYNVGINLDKEQREIAEFWDCNPYVSHHQGHVMFATKKITPGGHWIGITKIATTKAKSSLMETSEAYARVSIALADAFISCWDEKYRSSLIRPETVINQYVDEDWVPLLQTPPFPEYTSGHSVISTAAAEALTLLYGDNFGFVDSTEVEYGLPARTFESFRDACEEAAISRLYGGIHYMPAITNGVDQGRKVGEFVNKHVKTRQKPEEQASAIN